MAVKYFLQVPGVPGESTSSSNRNWIDVLSFSWGRVGETSINGGSLVPGVKIDAPLVVTAYTGKHTPGLMNLLDTADSFAAKLDGVVGSGSSQWTQFLRISMTGAAVRQFDLAGSASTDYPVESWSLVFSRVTVEYWPVTNGTRGDRQSVDWSVQTQS